MYNYVALFLLFLMPCIAMEQKIVANFAGVTLVGLNRFAAQNSLLALTDNSYETLRNRLKELRIAKESHEFIAMKFYTAEKIKESRAVKKLLTLVNMRMSGLDVLYMGAVIR